MSLKISRALLKDQHFTVKSGPQFSKLGVGAITTEAKNATLTFKDGLLFADFNNGEILVFPASEVKDMSLAKDQ